MSNQIPKDWKERVKKSGKFFEQQIATMVSESGFGFTIPNYSFVDIEKGISREMDVFAISGRQIGRKWNFIFPVLLISVSNKPLVCFTREELIIPYTTAWPHFSGMPKNIYARGEKEELQEYLKLDKKHYYYKNKRISSQFWSPLEKNESEGRYFYKDLVLPLVKAVVAERQDHEKEWFYDPKGEPINLQFYYPIIVVRDLWECRILKGKTSYHKADSVLFLFHTATEKYSGDYLIDVCTQEGLREILKNIEKITDKSVDLISKKRKLFEVSALKDAKIRKKKTK